MTTTFGFNWDDIESRKRDDEPPVGSGYLFELAQTTDIKVGKNGRRGFSIGCRVLEDEHEGKMFWQWLSLEESNIEWTKGIIETLGCEDALRSDGCPKDLEGAIFQADIVERNSYKNLINIIAQDPKSEKKTKRPAPRSSARVGSRR